MPKVRQQTVKFEMYRKFATFTVVGVVLLAIFASDDKSEPQQTPLTMNQSTGLTTTELPRPAENSAGAWGKDPSPDDSTVAFAPSPGAGGSRSPTQEPAYIPEPLQGKTTAERAAIQARIEAQSARRSGNL